MSDHRTYTLEEALDVLDDVAAGGLSATEQSHQEWVDARRVVFGEDDEVVVAHDIVRDCGSSVHRLTTRELVDQVAESLADLRRRFDAEPKPDAAPSLVIGCKEAARLLGIQPAALYARVARGQVPGVIRTGKTIGFLRSKLEAGLARRAR
jgi:predicted DNA-binding transcriptional regulator AlpA